MIAVGMGVVLGAEDVVEVALKEWSSGDFSSYIFCLGGVFKIERIIVRRKIC